MGKIIRAFFAFVFPPLAVLDKGCGAIAITSFLTMFAWIPGVIAALYFGFVQQPHRRVVTVPTYGYDNDYAEPAYDYYDDKPKREYIRLVDGELGEIIEDDGAPPDEYLDDEDYDYDRH